MAAGDVAHLSADGLANLREFTAVAARVAAGDYAAMKALGANANVPDAFRWAWALLREDRDRGQRWQHFRAELAKNIVIPEELRGAVEAYLLTDPAGDARRTVRQPTPEELLRPVLLLVLDECDGYPQHIATQIIATVTDPVMRDSALQVLGRSQSADDRDGLITAIEGSDERTAIRTLIHLAPPLREVEQDTVVARTVAATGRNMAADLADPLKKLIVALSDSSVADLIREAQATSKASALIRAGVLTTITFDTARSVLSADGLSDEVRQELVHQQASRLTVPRDEVAVDFAVWLHATFSAAWTKPVRDAILNSRHVGGRMGSYERPEARARELGILRRFAEVCDDPVVAEAYARPLRLGELAVASDVGVDAGKRYGWVAGHLLNRDEAQFVGDIVGCIAAASASMGGAFVTGLVEIAQKFPTELAEVVLAAGNTAIAVAARGGREQELVAAATRVGPHAAAELLCNAAEWLTAEDADRLTQRASWNEAGDRYPDVVDALAAHHPDVLALELARAAKSLVNASHDRIPGHLVAHLLGTCLDADITDPSDVDVAATVHTLLASLDAGLRELALRWTARANPTEALLSVVTSAHTNTADHTEAFEAARASMASRLIERASDGTVPLADRLDALQRAASADAALARIAAFNMATDDHPDVRGRAAGVLLETPPLPEDERRLRDLQREEPVAAIKERLERAVHRISSPSVGDALARLFEDFDIEHPVDVDALLPDTQWHEAAIDSIDEARKNEGGAPSAYINALITLGDLLVEQFLVHTNEADSERRWLRTAEAEQLRHAAPNKPNVGDLVVRQQLLQQAPWLVHHASLRQLRKAHPTPTGQTTPLRVKDEDRLAAARLFALFLERWAADLLALRK